MKHDIAWWRKHYKAVGRSQSYTADQIKEYALYIELAAAWMELYPEQGKILNPEVTNA